MVKNNPNIPEADCVKINAIKIDIINNLESLVLFIIDSRVNKTKEKIKKTNASLGSPQKL